jgi:hypothetical protein
MVKLIHYSRKPVEKLVDFETIQQPFELKDSPHYVETDGVIVGIAPGKPAGFWVSAKGDDDWASWCRSSEYCDTQSQYAYTIALTGQGVLFVEGEKQLDAFHEKYSFVDRMFSSYNRKSINWKKVCKDYDGIVIAPYVWSRRLTSMGTVSDWYYGWDCASGVIWRPSKAISKLTLIQKPAEVFKQCIA